MVNLKDYCEAIEYKITEGSEYTWNCYGPNARYLESHGPDLNNDYSIHCIFDCKDHTVYAIEAWDYRNDREYRWIHPEYQKAFRKECKKNNVDPAESIERNFIELDVTEDILEKINAIVNNREYDTRVKVPVDFSDEELLQYMKIAHERDITFNQLVEEALREAIEEHERDPNGFAKKAKRFINENSGS
jgi:hypothetical protein